MLLTPTASAVCGANYFDPTILLFLEGNYFFLTFLGSPFLGVEA